MAEEADDLAVVGGGDRPVDSGPARHGRLLARAGGARGRPGATGHRAGRPGADVWSSATPPTPPRSAALDFSDAFVLVSSKSGTTLEPNVLFDHAWSQLPDPAALRRHHRPRHPARRAGRASAASSAVFENPPDIGGRYSVLSYFGMVPAALIGYDVAELCERALDADLAEAAGLGMAMGEAATAGRDKVTIVVPRAFAAFGLWVEQLIAESTGKRGTGCVPVPTTEPEVGADRHVVPLAPGAAGRPRRAVLPVGAGHRRSCGHVLGIDPFDEPNVAESKANTNDVLGALPLPAVETRRRPGVLGVAAPNRCSPATTSRSRPICPSARTTRSQTLRRTGARPPRRRAVTAGYGPRFLHSTGQLHKGGPNTVVARPDRRADAQPELADPGQAV